jgi:redox-sensitive bicupin YhaK (pirin superfamily)
MGDVRKVRHVLRSQPTVEGAGVHLRRAFGHREVPMFDPFLLLDDFRSDVPERYLKGFPWHPHRGIETVTYMLDGTVEHCDSLGNAGNIGPGDMQWMTAGGGIIHQEMPRPGPRDDRMGGFQLWVNLPAASKMMPPRYMEVRAADVPEATPSEGVTARVLAGHLGGVRGPVRDIVAEPEYLDVRMSAGMTFEHDVARDHTVLAYVIEGQGTFSSDARTHGDGTVVLFGEGDAVSMTAAAGGPMRLLLISGRPIGEPVAWGGPIVMNTDEELELAFREYRDGTFIKK